MNCVVCRAAHGDHLAWVRLLEEGDAAGLTSSVEETGPGPACSREPGPCASRDIAQEE